MLTIKIPSVTTMTLSSFRFCVPSSSMSSMSSDPDHILKAGPEASGVRLDKWLAAQLAPMSRSRVRGLIEAGRVRLCREGAAQTIAEADHSVKPGEGRKSVG